MPVRSPLIFFPGAVGDGDFWSPVAARLPADRDKRLLSWPGAGAVPASAEVNCYRDLIAFAAAAVPDGSDVVAQSMGGAIAIGVALGWPQKIRRLVLVATSGGLDVAALGAGDWRAEYRDEFPEAAAWVTEDRLDHGQRLDSLELPVCLIWGDADPLSPVAAGEVLHAKLAASELHVLHGGTHSLARDRADEVAALIEQHLAAAPES